MINEDLKKILVDMTPAEWEACDYDIRVFLARLHLKATPYKGEDGYIHYKVKAKRPERRSA